MTSPSGTSHGSRRLPLWTSGAGAGGVGVGDVSDEEVAPHAGC